jgi:hypothetical protein
MADKNEEDDVHLQKSSKYLAFHKGSIDISNKPML